MLQVKIIHPLVSNVIVATASVHHNLAKYPEISRRQCRQEEQRIERKRNVREGLLFKVAYTHEFGWIYWKFIDIEAQH